MTPQECDTFAASTMAASAGFSPDLAWSQCDAEPHCLDYADEPSSWWKWVLVITAWAAGAVALAVVVGLAFVALTPHQQQPTQPQQQEVTSVLNDGTIAPFPPDKPRNT